MTVFSIIHLNSSYIADEYDLLFKRFVLYNGIWRRTLILLAHGNILKLCRSAKAVRYAQMTQAIQTLNTLRPSHPFRAYMFTDLVRDTFLGHYTRYVGTLCIQVTHNKRIICNSARN